MPKLRRGVAGGVGGGGERPALPDKKKKKEKKTTVSKCTPQIPGGGEMLNGLGGFHRVHHNSPAPVPKMLTHTHAQLHDTQHKANMHSRRTLKTNAQAHVRRIPPLPPPPVVRHAGCWASGAPLTLSEEWRGKKA